MKISQTSEQRKWLQKKQVDYFCLVLGTLSKQIRIKNNEIEIQTTFNNLCSVLTFLQKHTLSQYKQLVDIAAVDQPGKYYRFSVTYLLFSQRYNSRIKVTVQTDEIIPLPSVTSIFNSANWLEREVWDLYGIFFSNHPDLRRILSDYGFSGHSLRKEFPITGFVETYYDDSSKQIIYEKIGLAQEFRTYTLQNPWIKTF